MEGGELAVENMESLTELGDELTLGDIDGGRRGQGRGSAAWGVCVCSLWCLPPGPRPRPPVGQGGS